jgi:hypothetical protein
MMVQRLGLLRIVMQRNIRVSKIVALVVAVAKLHNFCIVEFNVPERLPEMYDSDRLHVMNDDNGYVGLSNDDLQQNTLVPTELMKGGEHFEDITSNDLRAWHRQSA